MRKMTLAVLATVLVAGAGPAFAKDCESGYKAYLAEMSKNIEIMSASWLADAGRKSAEAYAACKAGDEFAPYGVWQNLVAEMATKRGGK